MRRAIELWRDERGFIVSSELVLIATILVIPMVVGMQTVRDAVVQELGDVGQAVGNLVQSYRYSGVVGCNSVVYGSRFQDFPDKCEGCICGNDRNCLSVCIGATGEGPVVGPVGVPGGPGAGAVPLPGDFQIVE